MMKGRRQAQWALSLGFNMNESPFTAEEIGAMAYACDMCIAFWGQLPDYLLIPEGTDLLKGISLFNSVPVERHCAINTRIWAYSNEPKHIPIQVEIKRGLTNCDLKDSHICTWKPYVGLTERYEYCEGCNDKR